MSSPATANPQASPTPILDRLQPMPKPEGRGPRVRVTILVWLGSLALGVLLFAAKDTPPVRWAARPLSATEGISPASWTLAGIVLFLISIVVLTFVAIAVHELGHALVGALAGFRFNSLRIGRLQFDRPFRISLYRGRGTGSGGWASLFPVKHDHLVLRAVAMLLAGPLANLFSIAVLLVLPYSKGVPSLIFVFVSLLLGLMNLVPFRNRAVVSDGGRIAMLLANRARGERWLALLKLVEEMRTGVPAEKMTPDFLAKAVAIEDESPDTIVAFSLAYAAAYWQRDNEAAARALETCLRHVAVASPTLRVALISDAAVFQARRSRRADLAAQWQQDLPGRVEFPWIRPRGEAAILEAAGDVPGALHKLDDIEALLRAVPNQALREISLRNLARWKAELIG